MGHVDGGDPQILLESFDLPTHGQPETGVEVRQRLVEQQEVRLLHQGAPKSHPLLLPARQLSDLAIQQIADAHHVGHRLDPFLDLTLAQLLQSERVADVAEHRHMGVEGVALKHHADATILGGYLVDDVAVE